MTEIEAFLPTRYDSIRRLTAKGAFGAVYECRREGRVTAVKVLKPDFFADAGETVAAARFRREVETLTRLRHPNLVRVFEAHLDGEPYWYEMEYAAEGDLEGLIPTIRHDLIMIVDLFRQICAGVRYLHDMEPPIIHRDLKPRNILLFPESASSYGGHSGLVAKVGDLGHVFVGGGGPTRLTKGSDSVGTEAYQSYQQRHGSRNATVADDVYSLGVILIEMCTGQAEVVRRGDVYAPLRDVVLKMTEHRPENRYQSVADVLDALRSVDPGALYREGGSHPLREWETLMNRLSVDCTWDTQLARQFDELLDASTNDPGMVMFFTQGVSAEVLERAVAADPHFAEALVTRFLTVVRREIHEFWDDRTQGPRARFLANAVLTLGDSDLRWRCLDTLLDVGFEAERPVVREIITTLLMLLRTRGEITLARKAVTGSARRDELDEYLTERVEVGAVPRDLLADLGL